MVAFKNTNKYIHTYKIDQEYPLNKQSFELQML